MQPRAVFAFLTADALVACCWGGLWFWMGFFFGRGVEGISMLGSDSMPLLCLLLILFISFTIQTAETQKRSNGRELKSGGGWVVQALM